MQNSLNHATIPKLDNIYEIADKNGVRVLSYPLPLCRAVSVMDGQGECTVGIDNSVRYSESEEKTMLAHELGHCVTGAFYNSYSPFSVKAKCERKADEWAILCCVPYNELISAMIDGANGSFELAEHFGVSEQLIRKAIDYYLQKGENNASV